MPRNVRSHFGQPFRFTGFCKGAREQQGTGIVVDTVAVRPVGHRMNRVLEQPRLVTQRQEMPILISGITVALQARRDRAKLPVEFGPDCAQFRKRRSSASPFVPTSLIGSRHTLAAHGMTADVVGQQTGNLAAGCLGIAKRNQNAPPSASSSLACQ